MKNVFLTLFIVAAVASCNEADTKTGGTEKALTQEEKNKAIKDSASFTSLEWLDSTFQDLGKVKEGRVVEVSYRFKNTGKHPLIIADVTAGCGCTTPDKPQAPIMPGEESMIKAKFDSKGRTGENQKSVYVTANTVPVNNHTLSFRVEVTN
ncbi:MAG: DUF1573 domain-containing protein [Chitinophagaceae bacterium]|nr:DUF1573 domain-containing protein [Chitinophagaceae bacterium]